MADQYEGEVALPVECSLLGGPHDGESFFILPLCTCPLLPEAYEWPAMENDEAGYHRYEAAGDTQYATNGAKTVMYRYEGFRALQGHFGSLAEG